VLFTFLDPATKRTFEDVSFSLSRYSVDFLWSRVFLQVAESHCST
ncbi:unnamed protein product, partial [Amoebophrya sp. A25]